MNITYGLDVLPENDPHIAIAEASLEGTTAAAVPGAFLVDFFPVRKHLFVPYCRNVLTGYI